MRILIAEDEERARRGLHSVLTSLSEDYEVVAEASNGKQALELLQILKPDVVFTDLKMPFLDGMGLIKAGIAAGVCTKYVIVSAYEEFEVARQAISLGVKEYLVKPVTYDELKDTMERLDAAQKGKPQLIDKTEGVISTNKLRWYVWPSVPRTTTVIQAFSFKEVNL